MIDWLLQNVGKLITFVIVVYYIVSAVRGAAAAKEAEEPDEETRERARQIQEEIRRKILERQTQQPGGPVARPQAEPTLRPALRMEEEEEEQERWPTPVRREVVAPPPLTESFPAATRQAPPAIASEGESAYARQMAEIDVQIKKAEGLRQKAAEFLGSGKVSNRRMRSRAAAGEMRARLVEDLHNRSSIKVAIALKEVLDKPVGLR